MTSLPPALKPSGNACTACAVAAPTLWNSLPVDIKTRNLCLFLKRGSKHFFVMNFTCPFITLFFSLCILYISYICKFICLFLLFYFLYLLSALRLCSCALKELYYYYIIMYNDKSRLP